MAIDLRRRSKQYVMVSNAVANGAHGRDSQFGQRIGHALAFEFGNGIMDGLFERGGVGEGLVGEVIGFEIVPDRLDIIGVTW